MLEIVLIRHSKTSGNLEGRYIGSRTDESLCPAGIALLQDIVYPSVERVYTSPMKRCVETSDLIWPEHTGKCIKAENLRECDFGTFENKNYLELSDDPMYQAWIDSNGTMTFPDGESPEVFKIRCQNAFAEIVQREQQTEADPGNGDQITRIGIVAHGGTIMSIMEKYGEPSKSYYDYQVKNGCGYILKPAELRDKWNYQSVQMPDVERSIL